MKSSVQIMKHLDLILGRVKFFMEMIYIDIHISKDFLPVTHMYLLHNSYVQGPRMLELVIFYTEPLNDQDQSRIYFFHFLF